MRCGGTMLLIMVFGLRGFVVGSAFSKTEAVQAALVTALFLGERLPLLAWIGIVAGVAGVLVLALAGRGVAGGELWRALGQPAALCGLGEGSMFAPAAIAGQLQTRSEARSEGQACVSTVRYWWSPAQQKKKDSRTLTS